MKGFHFFTMTAAVLAFPFFTMLAGAQPAPRERLSFNDAWRFTKDDPAGTGDKLSYPQIKDWVTATGSDFVKDGASHERPKGNLGEDVPYTQAGFDDSGWRTLNLPHDWGIESAFKQEYPGNTGRLPWWGVGWYRKHFNLPASDDGRRIFLDVDGAMSYANVWLNGRYVGGWPYGYASWRLDLTPYLKFGDENVLAIRLDNPPNSSRWYPGGGMYRNVWLVKTAPAHLAHWGVYVTTPDVSASSAKVAVRASVDNESADSAKLTVRTVLYPVGPDGARRAQAAGSSEVPLAVDGGTNGSASLNVTVANPSLWSPDHPNLYASVTTLQQGDRVVDQKETLIGIRAIKFDPDRGFLLNGQLVELKGVCDHHDLGPLGAAINLQALERQVRTLKEMGCNAIRTSHNPPAPELLDVCDRVGMLVMDEAFDAWRHGKTPNDYHLLFDDWHEKDWRAQIRRDRNHPCVILWSTGNEIAEQGSPAGHQVAADLERIAHEEDDTRPATAGCNSVQAGYNGFQKTVDVFGYNYKPGEYGRFHERNPALPLFGSETASCVSSRGEYFFPVSDDKSRGRADTQVSSYDLYAPPWAMPPDTEFRGQDEYPFVAGEFVWTGWDYLGEPTPYGRRNDPARSSYFGIIDLAGFKKDRFFIYQARWRPDLPMAHILPHWNWPDRVGKVTPVHVYTSGDEAELFLNGKSLGRKKKAQYQYRLRWDHVVYEPGELKVVAYKDGKEWATDVMKTTGPAAKLVLEPDRQRIRADRTDLCFIAVKVADKQGLMVPQAHNPLRFTISGPGEIVATANGDPTNHEAFHSTEREAFNGLCLVIIRGLDHQPGNITVKAESGGLDSGSLAIESVAAR